MTGAIPYQHMRFAVEHGVYVVVAAGAAGGEPAVAWFATVLTPRSAHLAYDPDPTVRAAQAAGAIVELGRQMRPHGFTPA